MGTHTTSRKVERILAAQFLYSLEYSHCDTVKNLEESFTQYLHKEYPLHIFDEQDFSWQLILGVWSKQDAIDKELVDIAHNWKIERIGKMELVALRIALYEILYTPEVPKNVVLKEALDIVKEFGDINANTFIVAIIENIGKQKEE